VPGTTTGFKADDAQDAQLWSELLFLAPPALMLRFPATARLLDIGTSGAGTGLALAELAHETLVADSNPKRLSALRALAQRRRLQDVSFSAQPLKQLLALGSRFDVVLMPTGWCGIEVEDLRRALNPSGQLLLHLTGGPGSALAASRKLRSTGFPVARIVVPWPPTARVPLAWVDIDSNVAWKTLLDRWQASVTTLSRRGLARAWNTAAAHAADALRVLMRCTAPRYCILATR
jgi:hypothetical protein